MIAAGVNQLFPFGGESIYFSDLAGEFSTFLTELWRKIHNGGDLFYSWKTGVGGSFLGNILFYLSSPLNLIVLVGKESSIDENMAVLIYLRQALSAVFMCYYLSKRRDGRTSFAAAIGGILYGSCGWFCGFYFITILLDAFMLIPLLLLGIERIIDSGHPALYFAILTVILFSNFYISYSVCLFAVLYWLYYFFVNYRFGEQIGEGKKESVKAFFSTRFFKAGTIFAVSSVLSVLSLACIFIPLLAQMSNNIANEDAFSLASFSNITQQITALFSGCEFNASLFRGYAPVYTGILSLTAAPLYFFHKEISRREKIGTAVFLLFMLLSFNIPILDYIWHGFRYPTNVLFRQSYIVPVLLVMMTYRVLSRIEGVAPKSFFCLIGVAVVLIVCGIVELKTRGDTLNISVVDLIVTVGLFLMFTWLLFLMRRSEKGQRVAALTFCFLFCIGDGAYTFTSNINSIGVDQAFLDTRKAEVRELIDKVGDDDLFYRTEIVPSFFNNDGAYFDYYGITQSSSTATAPIQQLIKDFGADSNANNCIYYDSQTPLFNSIFGVRYQIEDIENAQGTGVSYLSCAGESYRLLESNNDYDIFRFGNALPLGFVADASLSEWKAKALECPENQSSFYAVAADSQESAVVYCDDDLIISAANPEEQELTMSGEHRYTIKKTVESGGSGAFPGVTLSGTAALSGMLYVYAETISDQFTNVLVYINSDTKEQGASFKNSTRVFTEAVCDVAQGDSFSLTVFSGQGISCDMVIRIFQIDPEVFTRQHAEIERKGQLELAEFSDAHFKGGVSAAKDGVLCLTVPYDKGWTVLLDGKELSEDDYSLIGGVLYGLPVEQGEHEVEFTYHLYGAGAGIAVSCVSIIMLAAFLILLRKIDPIPQVRETEIPEGASI